MDWHKGWSFVRQHRLNYSSSYKKVHTMSIYSSFLLLTHNQVTVAEDYDLSKKTLKSSLATFGVQSPWRVGSLAGGLLLLAGLAQNTPDAHEWHSQMAQPLHNRLIITVPSPCLPSPLLMSNQHQPVISPPNCTIGSCWRYEDNRSLTFIPVCAWLLYFAVDRHTSCAPLYSHSDDRK